MSLDGDDANILNVDTAIANIADLSPPTPTAAAAAAAAPRKRGRPQVVPLDDLKDEIVRLFADGLWHTRQLQ